MTKKFVVTTLALAALAAAIPAQAAISIDSAGATYSQSFDALGMSASNPWVNDSTLAGWSLFTQAGNAASTYAGGTGSSNAGSFYSFGAANSAERALGAVASGGNYFGSPASGAIAGWIAVALTNNTGGSLTQFTIAYDGEQWRNGGNTTAQTLVLEYGFGGSFATVGAWTPAGVGFNFTSTINTSTAASINGNTSGLVGGLGGTVATNWGNGSTLWVRWADTNYLGSDHGLAVDNFSITAVPEPESYALMLAGLAGLAFVARRRKQ